MLVVFKKTLAPGSTRLMIYETEITKAVKAGRLPFQAQAVFDEIVAKLKGAIRESKLQKQTRVENEFNAFEMGRLPHATFLAGWEKLLEALDDAGVAKPDPDTLFRRYLHKLSPELRAQVLSRPFSLDAGPPRRPTTWEECAECVGAASDCRRRCS